ncbi:MAG: methylmalonyl Co-A mutase-associated GTPase MeaB [Nitrososphaerales archaeon]|nr:methylmalonyl Co-A mutase-associated GTPase MeaB [Nitrososphaerales archaeon]
MDETALARDVMAGDRRAIARAITLVENDGKRADLVLTALSRSKRGSFLLGVTGPPGAGKSTLVDRLIEAFRARELRVGVIAVDPTSPITGGALLGDRVRMLKHSTDEGVFIRSMASRGWAGGLNRAIPYVIQILEASGCDIILIETVGVGQADIEVMKIAHSVLVVLTPGFGDDIQASKAGLMEIGDIYVVNKSDLEGAELMVVNLLSMVRDIKGKRPYVLKTSALKGEGIDRLTETIEEMRSKLHTREGEAIRKRGMKGMIIELAKNELLEELQRVVDSDYAEKLAEQVLEGKMEMKEAARRLEERA